MRPQRYRTLLGFLMGLAVSVIVIGAGYAYYKSHIHALAEAEKTAIGNQAVEAYKASNPTSLVYVAANDKKAGEVLLDTDLVPAEISTIILPEGSFQEPSSAIGKVLRCDIVKNTVITGSLIYEEAEYPDDLRRMEYTVINLPQKLEASEYVDIRVMFPNGLDYIVLSKKKVTDLKKADESSPQSIIWLNVGEEEILRMASAIVDASIVENAILYAVPYIAPEVQNEAVRTYPPNAEVQNLILQNPNIVEKAVTELEERNRRLFEERINSDNRNAGGKDIFGEDLEWDDLPLREQPTNEGMGEASLSEGRL